MANYFEKVLDEIEIRNEIKIQLEESKQPKKRKYQIYTPEQRAEIREYWRLESLHGSKHPKRRKMR